MLVILMTPGEESVHVSLKNWKTCIFQKFLCTIVVSLTVKARHTPDAVKLSERASIAKAIPH